MDVSRACNRQGGAGDPRAPRTAHSCRGSASRERNHGVGDHPIPFRTRQLSSPSSMILRILTWESRTTPRLYFQRAVLSRTALCFLPEAHPHRGHPSLSPRPGSSPSCCFLPSLGSPPPSFCFLRLYPPGSLYNRLTCSLFTFFSQALPVCRRRVLDAVSERDASLF